MNRRRFLAVTGGSLVALAGCMGDDGESDVTPSTTPTSTPGVTPTSTPGVTPTSTPGVTPTETPEETPTSTPGVTPTETPEETPTETPVEGPGTVLEAAEGLVDEMAAGQFDRAFQRFPESGRASTSPGELEAVWLGYTNVGGAFEGIVDTEETVQSGFDAVDVTLGFERGDHTMRVLTGEEFSVVGALVNDEYEQPEYVEPDSFSARETQVETEDCLLDATVTVPEGDGEAPGVVLVHGSDPIGAADKNLDNGGSRPFQELAEGLASRGVAALRYDRRTHGCPNSFSPDEHTLDTVSVDDALVAIEQLRGVDGVDPDRIVVVGHSLGAMAVPRIAQRDGNLAGGVPMAAPARSFHEIFVDQYEHLATLGEFEWDRMQQAYDRWQDRIDRIREGDYAPSDTVLGYPGALWDSVDEYDHVGTARSIDTPLLFLQGERDYQVTVADDFTVWQSELDGRDGTTFRSYEGLNHIFQFGTGPSVLLEYSLRNPVDRQVVADVAGWVRDR
jgi:fermentation-respiration switch protein FrsA (DUF1100 family)